MISRISSQANRVFEHSLLSVDVARALRSSIAMAAAWTICLLTGHAWAAALIAPTAQNVAMPDVRGDYRLRLAILFTLTLVISLAAFLGTMASGHIVIATFIIGLLALAAGCWRHLSADYGPQFAIAPTLVFFIALSQPGDASKALLLAGLTALAGVGGILIQLSGWFIRPQHALRHATAESWVAASDLINALRTETDEGQPNQQNIAEPEAALRATIDRTLAALEAATNPRNRKFISHLDDITQLAARLATRVTAFYTALEPLKTRDTFKPIAATLDTLLRSLANTTRAAAITVITHRREHFLALHARLQRTADLTQVLDRRLAALDTADTEVSQSRQLLAQVNELLPVIHSTVEITVDHAPTNSGFALRFPELGGLSAKTMGSWLNSAQQLDSVLIRYTLRITVLLMATVAAYQFFSIPRGYWIPFTTLIVLQPDYGSTRQKAAQRILGTVTGSLIASLVLWIKLPLPALVASASLMAFCFAYFLRRHYAIAVFFVTILLVLLTEASMTVNLDFTLTRVLCTLAGGALALIAAFFFWPKWEQERFPQIIAAGLRANRNYLEAIAGQLIRGEPFTGNAIKTKREAERANSQSTASLQRLVTEPRLRQQNPEQAAALVTSSQRLTRAITVLAQHLNQRKPFTHANFPPATTTIAQSLATLADHLEKSTPLASHMVPELEITAEVSPQEAVIYRQLAKILTELEALALECST